MEFENNAFFWQKLDTLLMSSNLIIDRPKDSVHPIYANLIYPCDYGYLQKMNENDEVIDVFRGSSGSFSVECVIVCADILKKEVDVKLLVGCTEEEEDSILRFLNQTDFQKTIIVRRGMDTPDWAVSN